MLVFSLSELCPFIIIFTTPFFSHGEKKKNTHNKPNPEKAWAWEAGVV